MEKVDLVPVTLVPRNGYSVVLVNVATGYLAEIKCLYLVGEYETLPEARMVATTIDSAIRFLDCEEGGVNLYFSSFRTKVFRGKFPKGAKPLPPLRDFSTEAVTKWWQENGPKPLDALSCEHEIQTNDLYEDLFEWYSGGDKIRMLRGETLCSVP